jgi:hypothetical protein
MLDLESIKIEPITNSVGFSAIATKDAEALKLEIVWLRRQLEAERQRVEELENEGLQMECCGCGEIFDMPQEQATGFCETCEKDLFQPHPNETQDQITNAD